MVGDVPLHRGPPPTKETFPACRRGSTGLAQRLAGHTAPYFTGASSCVNPALLLCNIFLEIDISNNYYILFQERYLSDRSTPRSRMMYEFWGCWSLQKGESEILPNFLFAKLKNSEVESSGALFFVPPQMMCLRESHQTRGIKQELRALSQPP